MDAQKAMQKSIHHFLFILMSFEKLLWRRNICHPRNTERKLFTNQNPGENSPGKILRERITGDHVTIKYNASTQVSFLKNFGTFPKKSFSRQNSFLGSKKATQDLEDQSNRRIPGGEFTVKNFLHNLKTCSGYVKPSPRSGEHSAL